jgi:DNA-binding HxlR family transcriptional regulator
VLTNGKVTVGDLERTFPEINRRTLQRDLKAMLDKGVFREVGTGPTDPNRHYMLREL